jgi:hypothetical protein
LIEAFDKQVTELQLAIAAYEEKLARTIPTDGLGEHALAALGIFRDRLARGEGVREAALGTAGYNSLDVEAAMAKQDRHEMRAFEALLARSSWRRRLLLWLLGATNKRYWPTPISATQASRLRAVGSRVPSPSRG